MGPADALAQLLGAFGDRFGCEVVDDEGFHVGAHALECACGIEFAVIAGEDGDHDARTCHLAFCAQQDGAVAELGSGGFLASATIGEYGLQLGFPCFLQLAHADGFTCPGECVVGCGFAQVGDDAGNAVVFEAQGCNCLCQSLFGAVCCQLDCEAAVFGSEQVDVCCLLAAGEADAVANAHLEQGLCEAAEAYCVSCCDQAAADQLFGQVHCCGHAGCVGQDAVSATGGLDCDYLAASCLELGAGDAVQVVNCGCEADQGGGNVQVLEAAGHGVLAADGAAAQVDLCVQGAQQGCQGLAPTLCVGAQLLEVLLEGEVCVLAAQTGSDQAGNAVYDGDVCSLVLVCAGQVGVEAVCHAGNRGGFAQYGKLGDHCLGGGELALAAEGHQDGACADGGVKALGKALAGADVQVGDQVGHALFQGLAGPYLVVFATLQDMDVHLLGCAVACQELAAYVNDGLATPYHDDACLFGYACDDGGFQVFFMGQGDECVYVGFCNVYCHALLAFGDCQLGAVQAVVLAGHAVQVDEQAVCQLADCNADAACAEVVAALDHAACVATAEQALDLAFYRGVALLYFRAAACEAFHLVRLGGAGCAADAVTAGAAAQKDDAVAGCGGFAAYVVSGGCAYDGADFHALGHVAGVVQLIYLAGCQADLVAVARVAAGSVGDQLTLGQLAGDGFAYGDQGVCSTGDAHCLVYVAATGERVADSAADAGCCAAEGLDFRGMVVGFVLEQVQPFLGLAVYVAGYADGAGVDFLGLVQVGQDAAGLQCACADGADVHQADGLMGAAQFLAQRDVAVERLCYHGVIDLNVGQLGAEGGVAAVVGPVGVDHLDFGDGGVASLFGEVGLAELDVAQVHCQAAVCDEGGQALFVQVAEAVDYLDVCGGNEFHLQGFGKVVTCFAGLDRIDDIALDGIDGLGIKVAGKDVDLCAANGGALALADQLDAFACAFGALIELAGQEFDCEDCVVFRCLEAFEGEVALGLAENGGNAAVEQIAVDALDVVAVQQADVVQGGDSQDVAQFSKQGLRFDIEARLFLNVNSVDHSDLPFVYSFRMKSYS